MAPIELPISLPGLAVDEVSECNGVTEIMAHSLQAEAHCPACRQCSRRVHSHYQRSPADLPVSDRRVRLTVRRFRCLTPGCPKAAFAERLPQLIAPYARRTERLNTALSAVAFALGGQAGQRLAARLRMPVSGDTLLRIIRRTPEPAADCPQVIGVDDWAQRRGQLALHEKVRRLRRAGHNIRAIARRLQLSRWPDPMARKHRPSMLDPFVGYLTRRWREGCRNAVQLWREIRAQGCPGTRRQLTLWVYERRDFPARMTPTKYVASQARSGKPLFTLNEAADQAP